jgi:excisionase family DNA binding protein
MEKLWLRPAEVCSALNISRSMVYQLISSGVLPSVRIGRSVRIPADLLKRWIDETVSSSNGINPDVRECNAFFRRSH